MLSVNAKFFGRKVRGLTTVDCEGGGARGGGTPPRILIVTSKFNYQVTHSLQRGCVARLRELDSDGCLDLDEVWVPGAFEIPVVVARKLEVLRYDCVICLGAIVRGETFHFELLAKEVTRALMDISVGKKIPVVHEVLATENILQAERRSGLRGEGDNKGRVAAEVAWEMIEIVRGLE